jgi:hypothetical protein
MSEEASVVIDEESEFETAFAEIAAERDNNSDPDTEEEEELNDEELTAAASTEEAAEIVVEEDEPDPYEGMTDEVKAKFQALEGDRDGLQHSIDSDAGRVSAFQKKVDALQGEITTIRAGATAGPSQTQIADAMKGSDDEWDAFSQQYPDIASVMDKRLGAMGEKMDEAVAATLAPVNEATAKTAAEKATTANEERVDEVKVDFPTWTDEVKKPEFSTWMNEQSKGVADLGESDDARDASTLLGLYDAHLVANGHPSIKADPTESGVNEDTGKPVPTELETRRAKQLEDGASVASKKAGVNTDGPETSEFEAAFDVFAKRKDKQRA